MTSQDTFNFDGQPSTMEKIATLIERGALFVISHSAGKDSQAMTAYIRQIVPAEQIVVVHAHLAEVEWDGVIEHIESNIGDLELHIAEATKTFFQMVEHRGMWPSPAMRQCTSDLKRGPIERVVRRILKDRGQHLIVNCMGLRAQESASRAKRPVLTFSERNSKAGREWYDWLPIHDWTVERVFSTIEAVGQEPHWAYKAGMTRLSCMFCIMASPSDLKTAAKLNPETYKRYVETEKRLDHTFAMPKAGKRVFLEDLTGIKVSNEIDLTIPAFLQRVA